VVSDKKVFSILAACKCRFEKRHKFKTKNLINIKISCCRFLADYKNALPNARTRYCNACIFTLVNTNDMPQYLAHVTLVVDDYDEAIRFFTEKLRFELLEDTPLGNGKRWVLVAPPGGSQCCLLLARASNEEQAARVGNQTGGRVAFFLFTDDFWRDYEQMLENNVHFVRQPVVENYGIVAVFEDLYGNRWDLLQPAASAGPVQ
jgi:catechol 2,3-dioxygenase-like lactoylglutathione lyase family enzyme